MEPYSKQTAETVPLPTMQPAVQPTEEKANTASRSLVATAFGVLVAGKVNNIGTAIDANRVFKGQNMTIVDKLNSVWDRSFFTKLNDQFNLTMKEYPNNKIKGALVAGNRVFKYTIITTVIGAAIGGAIGWKLGGRIDNWRDIFKHPWQSTKVMFGFEKPDAELMATATPVQDKKFDQEKTTKWQDYAKERQPNSATTGKAV